MNPQACAQADLFLGRLQGKFGDDPGLVTRLRELLVHLFEAPPPESERRGILRLVAETYARHLRLRASIDSMRSRLQRRVNELYGRMLGIEPHH